MTFYKLIINDSAKAKNQSFRSPARAGLRNDPASYFIDFLLNKKPQRLNSLFAMFSMCLCGSNKSFIFKIIALHKKRRDKSRLYITIQNYFYSVSSSEVEN